VHADVDLEAGASAHFLSSRPSALGPVQGESPDAGPTFVLSGHVAVLPLLRGGAYVSHDFSPISGADLREITGFGFSLRLFSPWPRGALRLWLGGGLGYSVAYAPGYTVTTRSAGPTPVTELVSGTAGGYFEAPVGLGGSMRLSPSFELIGDMGVRIGFGFTGSMYNRGPTVSTSGLPTVGAPAAGDDVAAVFLCLGAAFEL
jgi:hypothetical protein